MRNLVDLGLILLYYARSEFSRQIKMASRRPYAASSYGDARLTIFYRLHGHFLNFSFAFIYTLLFFSSFIPHFYIFLSCTYSAFLYCIFIHLFIHLFYNTVTSCSSARVWDNSLIEFIRNGTRLVNLPCYFPILKSLFHLA